MIGSFMLNNDDEICFAQFSDERLISTIVIFENKTVLFTYSDGSDDFMTTELDDNLFHKIKRLTKILVAKIGDDGEPISENFVSLSFEH